MRTYCVRCVLLQPIFIGNITGSVVGGVLNAVWTRWLNVSDATVDALIDPSVPLYVLYTHNTQTNNIAVQHDT
jgi:hypothetical protein